MCNPIDANDFRRLDFRLRAAAVELLCFLVAVVPEAVPLAAALRVDVDVVVVDGPGGFAVEPPFEAGPVEGGVCGEVEGPVEGDALAELDFLRGELDDCGREAGGC